MWWYNFKTIFKLLFEITFELFKLLFWVGLYAIFIALPLQLLWNYLIPDIFGLPEITFWQAFWMRFLIATFMNTNISFFKTLKKPKKEKSEKKEIEEKVLDLYHVKNLRNYE